VGALEDADGHLEGRISVNGGAAVGAEALLDDELAGDLLLEGAEGLGGLLAGLLAVG
jgi:hypothetical protein